MLIEFKILYELFLKTENKKCISLSGLTIVASSNKNNPTFVHIYVPAQCVQVIKKCSSSGPVCGGGGAEGKVNILSVLPTPGVSFKQKLRQSTHTLVFRLTGQTVGDIVASAI